MYHHILPNSLSPIIVAITLSFSSSVLAESGLSYLGLGVQPPFASWGRMLKEAQPFIAATPSYIVIVGVVITCMVLGFNLLSDGIRDANARK
jgi:peptide/nickel transport system permease protein